MAMQTKNVINTGLNKHRNTFSAFNPSMVINQTRSLSFYDHKTFLMLITHSKSVYYKLFMKNTDKTLNNLVSWQHYICFTVAVYFLSHSI